MVDGCKPIADWTAEERRTYSTKTIFSNISNAELYTPPLDSSAPTSVDWRSKMPAIKNQGSCDSCWTFSTQDVTDFYGGSHSEQQVLDCSSYGSYGPCGNGCNGGNPTCAVQYLASKGAMSESSYPYKSKKGSRQYSSSKVTGHIHSAKSLSQSESSIASAAATQVVSIAITVGDSSAFQNYHSGVFKSSCGSSRGHVIAVVGYTSLYWIIRNNWATSWGVKGYMYMA